ncbi:hypothetical protein ACFL2T_07500 [Elusimicrobiota bacterium]
MENLQNKPIDWKITETGFFEVKSFVYPSGDSYVEYTSHLRIAGFPFVHMTFGRSPETGRRKVAKGFISLGRIAVGVIPVGQLAAGVFPIGQAAFGIVFALGQAAFGWTALGQLAIAWSLAVGQLAVAQNAIGQLAVGGYCIGQAAVGEHIYTPKKKDPETLKHFQELLPIVKKLTAG